MRRGFILLALSLSAGIASAQDPPAADRVPLPAILDSWYKVEQNKEHVGWIHQQITTTTASRTKYDYFEESFFDYTVKLPQGEQTVSLRRKINIALEDDFDIHQGSWQVTFNDLAKITLSVSTDEEANKRSISLTIPGETPDDPPIERKADLALSDPFDIDNAILMFKLRQRGDLAASTTLNRRGIPVARDVDPSTAGGLKIFVDQMVPRVVLDKSVSVTPVRVQGPKIETFPDLSQLWVDKYGRIVEAASSNEDFSYKLVANSQIAKSTGAVGIPNRGWRDPFSRAEVLTVKKGPEAGGKPDTAGAKKEVGKTPSEGLKLAGEAIQELRQAMARNDQAGARTVYDKFLEVYKTWEPQLTEPLEKAQLNEHKQEAEKLFGGVQKLLDEANTLVQRANDYYQADNIEKIEEILKQLRDMKDRNEFHRDERKGQIDKAISAVQAKRDQCQARIDLSAMVVELTGVITATETVSDVVKFEMLVGGARIEVVEPVKAVREITYAVVNGEPYREGEVVPRLGVKIEKIYRHAIVISYKKEIREVPMKKN